jgi:hypothetical protein
MELPLELWDKIYETCNSFKTKRNLYEALPISFRVKYPKKLVKDGDKCLLKFLQIYDSMNVTLSLKVSGYYSFQICPIEYKNLKLKYKDIPKTLDELFDFNVNIYQYYNSILTYNKYKITQGWKKNFISMDIEYQLKFLDNEIVLKNISLPLE